MSIPIIVAAPCTSTLYCSSDSFRTLPSIVFTLQNNGKKTDVVTASDNSSARFCARSANEIFALLRLILPIDRLAKVATAGISRYSFVSLAVLRTVKRYF